MAFFYFSFINTLPSSPIINGMKPNGNITDQSVKPREKVSKIGCRKGIYNTANSNKKAKPVDKVNVLFVKKPILNKVWC